MDTPKQTRHFPIDESLPALRSALHHAVRAVLSAPPGAGKTTRVPLALLSEEWLAGKKIVVLEPRRIAAIRAAQFMASMLGEKAGATVGYRIRGESVSGPLTRVEVVTEGVLTRLLQHAQDLPDTGLVIFDEFHERSIHADLGLALSLDVQEHLRPDLRILVMSATLDGVAVARMMGDAEIVESRGKSFAVETFYRAFPVQGSIEPVVAQSAQTAISEFEGDVLVFLPGQREIRRVGALLGDAGMEGVDIQTLFGDAAASRQRAALEPAAAGRRKIILATSIAETSLTIEGIRIVVDSGLARSPRFDPRRGMSGLVTLPVSRATADQRRGRAGREAPGVCYRIWTEEQHASLVPYPVPEILVTDLAPLVLDAALWGVSEITRLRLLDDPPPPHVQQARALLQGLGALDVNGRPTPHGQEMAGLPVHPRLSHMILRGKKRGFGRMACDIAALLEDRDILRDRGNTDIDLASRLHALSTGAGADQMIRERVLHEAQRLRRAARVTGGADDGNNPGNLLAEAFPERIARRRPEGGGHYLMVSGTGATIPEWSPLIREEFLAVADVEGTGTEVKVYLASPLSKAEILDLFADSLVPQDEVAWNQAQEMVIARRTVRLGALVMEERPLKPSRDSIRDAVFEGLTMIGLEALPWDTRSRGFQARSEWLRGHHLVPVDWPDISDARLSETLPHWLGQFVEGIYRRKQLEGVDLVGALRSLFSHSQIRDLERLAPAWIDVPSGSRILLSYSANPEPVLAVKLQELFGQASTPKVAEGKVGVLLHLLSPAGRPLAVTQDLQSFWTRTYPSLRGEMQSRYPKHHWPENPLTAPPTRRTKRR